MTEYGYNRRRQCVDWFYALNGGADREAYDYAMDCIDADYYNWERPGPEDAGQYMLVTYFDLTVFMSPHEIPAGPVGPNRWLPAVEYFA